MTGGRGLPRPWGETLLLPLVPTATVAMRRRQLEMRLQQVPDHPHPSLELEQYPTPPVVAGELLYEALGAGHIEGRSVTDLGSGTGVLALGAALLGASEVVGVEVDEGAASVADSVAQQWGLAVDFVVCDVRGWSERCQTVVMNPPFGAQRRHADRPFVETALAIAPVVYSLHNGASVPFLRTLAKALRAELTLERPLPLTLDHRFPHHRQQRVAVPVVLLRWQRQQEPEDPS